MVEGRVGNLVHEEAGPSPEASSRCTIGPNTTFSRPLRGCRPPTGSGSAPSPNCSARAARGSRTVARSTNARILGSPPMWSSARRSSATAGPNASRLRAAPSSTGGRPARRATTPRTRFRTVRTVSAALKSCRGSRPRTPTPTTSARPPRVVVRPSPMTCRGGRWSRVTSARSTCSLPSPVRGSPPRSSTPSTPRPAATATRGSATRRRHRWPCSARATSSA